MQRYKIPPRRGSWRHNICVVFFHIFCDNRQMAKNITLSIEDELLIYAKALASKQAKSLSRYIADHFKELKQAEENSLIALNRYKSRQNLFEGGEKRKWTREELYER